MSAVVMIGGMADADRSEVLFGDSIIVQGVHGNNAREVYQIVTLAGSTRTFEVAVPEAHALDGDWIIERLLSGYGRGRR